MTIFTYIQKGSVYVAILALLLLSLPSTLTAGVFYRNLSQGSTGADVKILQEILNQDPDTRVAVSGAGSIGNETEYFGALTKDAVKRYQEKHADTVLIPLGLSQGTGYFGPSTRTKIDGTAPTTQTPKRKTTITPLGSASRSEPPETGVPKITSLSPTSGTDGTVVTLKGSGFLPSGNTVHAGHIILEDVASKNGIITFTVHHPFPKDFFFPPDVQNSVPDFQYGFIVQNKNGISNTVEFTLKNSKIIEHSRELQPTNE